MGVGIFFPSSYPLLRSVSPSAVSSAVLLVKTWAHVGTEIGWVIGVGDHPAVRLGDACGVGVVNPISSCDNSETPPR